MDPSSAHTACDADVAVVGGGPSGAVVARLLASWGHRVVVLARDDDPARSLANSLPPSTQKLLQQTGIADIVDRVGFRTTGNTVWWGDRDGHAESFSPDGTAWGYQVERSHLDPLLRASAEAAGAQVVRGASVRNVRAEADAVSVTYGVAGEERSCRARMVLDCSGRAGVVAVPHAMRRHVPGGRMQALVGVWSRDDRWLLENSTHTFIETGDAGWAWSIPTSDTVRHIGLMVDGAASRLARGESLDATYRAQLALLPRINRQVGDARLVRAFACDASVYTASRFDEGRVLLVGDAGATLNPLSSFGIKKALASAWLAAVVAHTSLIHPERADIASHFFSDWSSQVWHVNLKRSREFAAEALVRHASAFWQAQASADVDESQLPLDEAALLTAADVRAALEQLRARDTFVLSIAPGPTLVSAPLVRGRVIASEGAIALGTSPRDVVRYVRGIDLVALVGLAPSAREVPTLVEHYCARHGRVALPDILGALALLLARGVLAIDTPHASISPR
ncbi:MAG: NAD(P)/FAD-dependent oxidoreductase [Vicinamibacterales bacterium]